MKQLMSLNMVVVSQEELHTIYEHNMKSVDQTFDMLPKYCIKKDGTIAEAKYFLQWTPQFKGDNVAENYFLFDITYMDSHLQYELNESDLESLINDNENTNMRFDKDIFSDLNLIPDYNHWRDQYCTQSLKLVFDLIYETSYDVYGDYEETLCFFDLLGYMDNDFNIIYFDKRNEIERLYDR